MNVQLLIDSVVQQTTVLIAQLATAGGARAPLAHVANQVFSDLAEELERQGLSRKVTADMFGISLRSYQRRVARLRESSSERGRTLWEAVFDFLASRGVTSRREVLERFARDDEELVRGILRDLVESGLAFCSGSGAGAIYRATSDDEYRHLRQHEDPEGLDEFVWAVVYRHGPLPLPRMGELVKLSQEQLEAVLARLISAERVQRVEHDGGDCYQSSRLVVERDARTGWEASVYDHYQAMVRTICARLSAEADGSEYAPFVGGSTYGFDVGPEHPLRAEVFGVLSEFRDKCSRLRQRVVEYNAKHGRAGVRERVVVYAGESITPEEADEGRAGQGQKTEE